LHLVDQEDDACSVRFGGGPQHVEELDRIALDVAPRRLAQRCLQVERELDPTTLGRLQGERFHEAGSSQERVFGFCLGADLAQGGAGHVGQVGAQVRAGRHLQPSDAPPALDGAVGELPQQDRLANSPQLVVSYSENWLLFPITANK
jgi:hypothetical protein